MTPTPLLIISDSASAQTGLARITRDLGTRVANCLPEFRVATLGYGGSGSRHLPFEQYHIHDVSDGWQIPELPEVWRDFAGDEQGIVMTIWDPSRLMWFAQPKTHCTVPYLRDFLVAAPFKRWGYFPIDAECPGGELSCSLTPVFYGYSRILAYSKWAENMLQVSLHGNVPDITSIPHGIDTSVFYPRDRKEARAKFLGQFPVNDETFLIGIVATNQPRKDFGLGIAACVEAQKIDPKLRLRLWIHTDTPNRHWNLPVLLKDMGMDGKAIITAGVLSDEEMAWAYSACDLTLGVGLGEGFGYPIFESLACGVPCMHSAYGGAAEWLPSRMLVVPKIYRYEGIYGCARPVQDAIYWGNKIADFKHNSASGITVLPSGLVWNKLWPSWAEWFKGGMK